MPVSTEPRSTALILHPEYSTLGFRHSSRSVALHGTSEGIDLFATTAAQTTAVNAPVPVDGARASTSQGALRRIPAPTRVANIPELAAAVTQQTHGKSLFALLRTAWIFAAQAERRVFWNVKFTQESWGVDIPSVAPEQRTLYRRLYRASDAVRSSTSPTKQDISLPTHEENMLYAMGAGPQVLFSFKGTKGQILDLRGAVIHNDISWFHCLGTFASGTHFLGIELENDRFHPIVRRFADWKKVHRLGELGANPDRWITREHAVT